jgi:cell division protein FtsN
MNIRIARSRRVQGGTLIGFVLGLLAGLGIALAVAVYVTKVPVPFVDRGLSRKPEQDAAEAEKNKGWNPNAQLGVKPVAPPPVPAAPKTDEDSKPAAKEADTAPAAPKAESRDPIAELLQSREGQRKEDAPSAAVPAEPFIYFVQVGAFRNQQEAESQRARVAMLGIAADVTEREQNGRPVFRVRVGPFNQRSAADATREQLEVNGVEAALVRVQR